MFADIDDEVELFVVVVIEIDDGFDMSCLFLHPLSVSKHAFYEVQTLLFLRMRCFGLPVQILLNFGQDFQVSVRGNLKELCSHDAFCLNFCVLIRVLTQVLGLLVGNGQIQHLQHLDLIKRRPLH